MKRILFLSVFGFLLSACGSGETDGGDVSGITGDSKTGAKVVYAIAGGNSTKATVYLGAEDDIFTVSNSGMTVYGNTGKDTVTIASGVTTVTLDQNIEQINLSGASTIYKFRQTGNLINVYDSTGNTLIVKVPVQGDSDGTILLFSDGYASTVLSSGVMTLGGATVSTAALPTAITPKLSSATLLNNTAPVANAGAIQNVATGALVTLDGSGSSDADGDSLTYIWAFTSKPNGSSSALSSITVAKPKFTPDVAGAYVFSLIVNDGKVSSSAASVTITATSTTGSITVTW